MRSCVNGTTRRCNGKASCTAPAGRTRKTGKDGDCLNTQKTQVRVVAAGTLFNLLLFGVKLYVGLAANSICIWSDAMNNLADALSFLLSLVVAGVGISFAWSSLERLLYPTPVWFSTKHFFIVLLTVLAKGGMYFFYRAYARKTRSDVLRVMQTDSLMDCFITTATLLSFTLTRYLSFAVDAIFGLAISVFLFVGAAGLLRTHLRALLGHVDKETRMRVASCISSCKVLANCEKIQYYIGKDNAVTAFVFAKPTDRADGEPPCEALERLAKETAEQTGVHLCFVLSVSAEKNKGRSGSETAEESHE